MINNNIDRLNMKSGQTDKFKFLDIFTVFMMVSPIHGMFYPLESYLAAGSHGDEAPLSVPVNPISLVCGSRHDCHQSLTALPPGWPQSWQILLRIHLATLQPDLQSCGERRLSNRNA
jgi:hypothetical protein